MKKAIILIFVLSLLLSGCNTGNPETSSLPADNIVSSNIINSSQASTVIPSNIQSSQPQKVDDGGKNEICPTVQYHFSCESMDDFIKWIKVGGDAFIGSCGEPNNPCSENFLNWRKTRNEISLPKLNNNDFELQHITLNDDHFFIRYYAKDNVENHGKHNRFYIYGYPLTEEQQKLSIEQSTKKFSNNPQIIRSGTSKWGQYLIRLYTETNIVSLAFVKSSVFYTINAINFGDTEKKPLDWQEEYFNYFDFETVSLE